VRGEGPSDSCITFPSPIPHTLSDLRFPLGVVNADPPAAPEWVGSRFGGGRS
jgi:hypothetical protein